MLSRPLDLLRLLPVTDDAVLRVSPVGAADLRQLPVGTDLQAKVIAVLPGRVYHLLVGERTYTVALPIDARLGDELQLSVVDRDLQRGPAPSLPAGGAGGAAITTLSPTARFITALLNTQAPLTPQLPLPGVVRPSLPLLPNPPGDVAAVATRLGQALATSGMFYEAHQAQWIAGQRSLAQLMQEPQARIAPQPEPVFPDAAGADVGAAAPAGATRAESPVHPALLPIVKEQLQTLSALQLAWNGPVWPGQDMHWEIAEEPDRDGALGERGRWQTRLKLRLPHLGDVSATLAIGAAGIAVTLTANTKDVADAMTADSAALRSALSKGGSRPVIVRIARAERP